MHKPLRVANQLRSCLCSHRLAELLVALGNVDPSKECCYIRHASPMGHGFDHHIAQVSLGDAPDAHA